MAVLLKLYEHISNEVDSQDLIGQVILRIIISVKKMTGGQFGAYGYLNYLKNNIHPSSLNGTKRPMIESKDGQMMEYDKWPKGKKLIHVQTKDMTMLVHTNNRSSLVKIHG